MQILPLTALLVLCKLLVALRGTRIEKLQQPAVIPEPQSEGSNSTLITQSYIWKRIGQFCRPGDIVIAESGTAQFGFPDARFPADVTYVTQLYYGSIGYSVPCCLGAALAQTEGRDSNNTSGRIILVVGDGSLQLTVQEIGTIIRWKLKPILCVPILFSLDRPTDISGSILINNDGYTIERAIHGAEEVYNDIATWNHGHLLSLFGAPNGPRCSRQVRTTHEIEAILECVEYSSPTEIQLLEVFMDKMDIPWRLKAQIEIVRQRSAS
jgi:pyruvate decarboxylase